MKPPAASTPSRAVPPVTKPPEEAFAPLAPDDFRLGGRVRFDHFDHQRKRLTIFARGGKVRNVPIPDPAFSKDLERLILDSQAQGRHHLLQRLKGNGKAVTPIPSEPMSDHGLHSRWYRKLAEAGILPEGTLRGERMHKARHSAGQRLLDATGNLKAVQQLLGHESILTTGDVYVGWDEDQLAASLLEAIRHDEEP
jgi:integrase